MFLEWLHAVHTNCWKFLKNTGILHYMHFNLKIKIKSCPMPADHFLEKVTEKHIFNTIFWPNEKMDVKEKEQCFKIELCKSHLVNY